VSEKANIGIYERIEYPSKAKVNEKDSFDVAFGNTTMGYLTEMSHLETYRLKSITTKMCHLGYPA
jgi:hypothetical protein